QGPLPAREGPRPRRQAAAAHTARLWRERNASDSGKAQAGLRKRFQLLEAESRATGRAPPLPKARAQGARDLRGALNPARRPTQALS
ncbi:unnamed protein product, partial [Prorocentrum cordatum]